MKTFLMTFVMVIITVVIFWRWLMKTLKPKTKREYETVFEANKREGGYSVLGWFIIIGVAVSIAITRLVIFIGYIQ